MLSDNGTSTKDLFIFLNVREGMGCFSMVMYKLKHRSLAMILRQKLCRKLTQQQNNKTKCVNGYCLFSEARREDP